MGWLKYSGIRFSYLGKNNPAPSMRKITQAINHPDYLK